MVGLAFGLAGDKGTKARMSLLRSKIESHQKDVHSSHKETEL